ncbi:hypothetical protein Tph_c21740 [Thermacetogenium phaeum DSM 12270]|uniref:Uncharacterized protein n=1 Tax=Thermacetogenium phaeum (strain ATCC BAA-254 / DSM 26808 / PB) TaxID=1089553 RepID=K4LJZ0_THEPS|nr:hypothetical protein Tph_c21740 [Thermacetogenium phaeum DSM 12270]
MLSGHDPARKGSVAPFKAKVMIRTSGECWLTCGESYHPALEDAPQFIEGRMSLIKALDLELTPSAKLISQNREGGITYDKISIL